MRANACMLEIRGLAASINDKPILHGIDLTVPQGEVHAIMGPNGSGKSTLAYVLSGREDYAVTGGSVRFDGQDLLAMAPEERAVLGVFLAFQAPIELPGVGNANFLRTALNALRRVARRERTGRGAVPQAGARRDEAAGDAGRHAAAERQCRFLRRREEAQRGAADGDPAAEAGDPRRDRQRAGHRRAEDRRRWRECAARAGVFRAGHHAPPAVAGSHRAGPRARAGRAAGSCAPAARNWRANWKRRATRRSSRRRRDENLAHEVRRGRSASSAPGEGAACTTALPVARGMQRPPSPVARSTSARGDDRDALLTGADGFLARYEDAARPPARRPAVRDAAAEAFRRAGLPGRRVEAWKYTDLRPIAAAAFHEPLDRRGLRGPAGPCAADRRRAPGVRRRPLPRRSVHAAGRRALHPLRRRTRHSARSPGPTASRWWRSTPCWRKTAPIIDVPEDIDAGADAPDQPRPPTCRRAADFHPRHCIRLAAGATLTLLETSHRRRHLSARRRSPKSHVAEGATLTHIRLQDEVTAAFHLATLYAEIAARGTYDSFTLNLGARMARTEVHARLAGPGATAHLNGAQLLAGTQHADFTTVVRHDAPHGTSRQTVKNVLAGRSRGVFQGRIEVARARAEDRRLPDEPGAAAVARRRDRHQAGTGNLRRRREVQPRRHGRRTGCRAAVLSAQPRHPGRRGALDAGARVPGRGAGCRDARRRPRRAGSRASKAGGRGRPHERTRPTTRAARTSTSRASAPISRSWRRRSAASRWCSSTAPPRRRSRAR